MTGTPETDHDPLHAKNYCVGFVDLLGQRAALRNQHLVVPSVDDPKHADFIKAIRSSVGAIIKLQEDAQAFLEQSGRSLRPPPLDSEEKRAAYEAMRRTHRKEQWWSDGILLYASLAEADGYAIVDYLGAPFQGLITGPNHAYLYDKARECVTAQREAFTRKGDSKLAFRYAFLDAYFESNPPIEVAA